MKRILLLLPVLSLIISGCFIMEIYKPDPNKPVFVNAEPAPSDAFTRYPIKKISIRKFIYPKMDIRDRLYTDLLKGFYKDGQLQILEGEAVTSLQEKLITENSGGDIELKSKKKEEIVNQEYKSFPGVDLVLSGTIYDYRLYPKEPQQSLLKVNIKLSSPDSGTIYWIADIEGYYRDVIYTIVNTIGSKKLSYPPIPVGTEIATTDKEVKQQKGKKENKAKKEEGKKDK